MYSQIKVSAIYIRQPCGDMRFGYGIHYCMPGCNKIKLIAWVIINKFGVASLSFSIDATLMGGG
jgi:hypothetical protein